MTATVYQLRDFQSKRAIERAHKELEAKTQPFIVASDKWNPFVETVGFTDTSPSEMIPYHGAGIDGIWTDTDPA